MGAAARDWFGNGSPLPALVYAHRRFPCRVLHFGSQSNDEVSSSCVRPGQNARVHRDLGPTAKTATTDEQ